MYAVEGGRQVGYATISGVFRASVWYGTAASRVDLGPGVLTATWTDGDYIYVGGSSGSNAVMWRHPRPKLPTSWWRVLEVGGLGVTHLYPPTYSHNGKLNFVFRVGSPNWNIWRDGSPWSPSFGGGPYGQRAAVNGLGRVATCRVAGLNDFVATDWNNWSQNAGATGSAAPLDIITGFHEPVMPSMTSNVVAYMASHGFNQGIVTQVSGTNTPQPYFYGRLVSGAGIVSAITEYDVSDTLHRGVFHCSLLGGLRAVISDDSVPGGENVLALQGNPTGIGGNWAAFWSPAVNASGDTAYCASGNGSPTLDRFIVINGQIAVKEGDVLDGVNLAGFEPMALDLSNDGLVLHTWKAGTRYILFAGRIDCPEYSRVLLDTVPLINLECASAWITNIKGKPTIDDNLRIATLVTLGSGSDAIIRTTRVCLADMNGDCDVDIGDFSILSSGFGSSFGGPGWNRVADLNFDGTVDIGDFSIFSSVFGLSCP